MKRPKTQRTSQGSKFEGVLGDGGKKEHLEGDARARDEVEVEVKDDRKSEQERGVFI